MIFKQNLEDHVVVLGIFLWSKPLPLSQMEPLLTLTSEFVKWTCPTLNLGQSIVNVGVNVLRYCKGAYGLGSLSVIVFKH